MKIKKLFKKRALVTLIALTVSCLFGWIGLNSISAHAEESVTFENVALTMENGASVRFSDDNMTNGLRFCMEMSKTDYEGLMANTGEGKAYESVSFGMLIVPADYLTAGHELTVVNVFGASAVYDWATWNGTEWVYSGSKVRIINLPSTAMNYDSASGKYVYYGSITNVRNGETTTDNPSGVNNLAREFVGEGYIKYTGSGGTGYKMADYSGDLIANNTRSMAYIAQMAVADLKATNPADEKINLLQTKYIDKVSDKTTSYKVEYYRENLDGTYSLYETDTSLTGNIDSSVSGSEKTYEGFTYDSSVTGTVASGKILANGKLVLKKYYKRNIENYTVTIMAEVNGSYVDVTSNYSEAIAAYNLSGKVGSSIDVLSFAESMAPSGYYFDSTHENCVYSGTIPATGTLNLVLYYSLISTGNSLYNFENESAVNSCKNLFRNNNGYGGSYYDASNLTESYIADSTANDGGTIKVQFNFNANGRARFNIALLEETVVTSDLIIRYKSNLSYVFTWNGYIADNSNRTPTAITGIDDVDGWKIMKIAKSELPATLTDIGFSCSGTAGTTSEIIFDWIRFFEPQDGDLLSMDNGAYTSLFRKNNGYGGAYWDAASIVVTSVADSSAADGRAVKVVVGYNNNGAGLSRFNIALLHETAVTGDIIIRYKSNLSFVFTWNGYMTDNLNRTPTAITGIDDTEGWKIMKIPKSVLPETLTDIGFFAGGGTGTYELTIDWVRFG